MPQSPGEVPTWGPHFPPTLCLPAQAPESLSKGLKPTEDPVQPPAPFPPPRAAHTAYVSTLGTEGRLVLGLAGYGTPKD